MIHMLKVQISPRCTGLSAHPYNDGSKEMYMLEKRRWCHNLEVESQLCYKHLWRKRLPEEQNNIPDTSFGASLWELVLSSHICVTASRVTWAVYKQTPFISFIHLSVLCIPLHSQVISPAIHRSSEYRVMVIVLFLHYISLSVWW